MSKVTVTLLPDIWGHFTCTAWKMLSGPVSWWGPRDTFWGRGVWPFLQGGLGRWWHFSPHQISSLSGHAVGHGEKLCTTACGQGLVFLTSSVTLLLAEPWNSLLQGSAETKCNNSRKARPVSWMTVFRITLNRTTQKKNLPQIVELLHPPRTGISTSWAGSGTWA